MSQLIPLVIDASVAAKWLLTEGDPSERALADELLTALHAGRVALLAPGLFHFEVASAISRGMHRQAIARGSSVEAESKLRIAIDRMLGLPISIIRAVQNNDVREAAALALHFSRTLYDMLYLRLAQELDCQWCTADEKVLAPTRADFPRDRILLLRDLPASKILA